jgi:uncharacterized protein (TIGR02266 family)
MNENPPRRDRATVKVRFSSVAPVRRIRAEQLPRGILHLAGVAPRPAGSSVEVIVAVARLEAVLRLSGTAIEPTPDQPGLLLALDDPQGALSSADSFIAFTEASAEDEPSPEDRRRSPRVASRVRVKLRFSDVEHFRDLYTNDISRGGIFVVSDDPRPPGTPVEVVLQPPGEPEGFVLRGEVTRAVEPGAQSGERAGMGVRFADVPPEITARIQEFLKAIAGVGGGAPAAPTPPADAQAPPRLPAGEAPPAEPSHEPAQPPAAPARPRSPWPPDDAVVPAPEPSTRTVPLASRGLREEDEAPPLPPADRPGFDHLFQPAPDRSRPEPPPPGEVPIPPPERRESARVMTRLQVKLRPTDLRRFRELYTRDISRGGVFVYTDHPHPRGTPVEVLLYPPGSSEPFTFPGEVVHVVPSGEPGREGAFPGMGIRFERIDSGAREVIERIISRVLEDEVVPPPPAQFLELTEIASPQPPPRAPEPSAIAVASAGRRGATVERRRDPRFPERILMLLRFSTLDDFREVYSRDISRGGVFLATDEEHPLRTQLEVMLLPPGAEEGIALMGEVVHVSRRTPQTPQAEPGLGLQFLDLTAGKKAAIEAVLSGHPLPRQARAPVEEEHILELEEPLPGEPRAAPAPGSWPPQPAPPSPPRAAPAPGFWPPQPAPPEALGPPGTAGPAEGGFESGSAEGQLPDSMAADETAPTASSARKRSRAAFGFPTSSGTSAVRSRTGTIPPVAAAPLARPLSVEEAQEAVSALEASLRKQSYYDVLGVRPAGPRARVLQALEARARAFQPDSYPAGVEPAAVSILEQGRLRLEVVRDTLLDPRKRAAYECSLGLVLDAWEDEGPDAAAQRRRVQEEFRERYAREFPEKVRKGEDFFRTAMEDLRNGDQAGALRTLKLALTFDPLNLRYHELLRKLQPR